MPEKRGRYVFVLLFQQLWHPFAINADNREAGKRHFKTQMGSDRLEIISVVAIASLLIWQMV